MIAPARAPRAPDRLLRFVRVDPRAHALTVAPRSALVAQFAPGDLLVVNDAATLPASLAGHTADGKAIELRLTGPIEADGTATGVVFGAGTWRTRTEGRALAPSLGRGARVVLAGGLEAHVIAVDPARARLVRIAFDGRGDALERAVYAAGRPVQYAHHASELDLWEVQTIYAGRPWAVEAPSAGFALDTAMLVALRARGVAVARLTHAAGLSSTGDRAIDAALPLPERFEVPAATVRAVSRARRCGGRVIAIGTSVARALEGNAALHGGRLVAACGITDHLLGPGARRRVVDGLWSGLHEPGASHFALWTSFASEPILRRALAVAEAAGMVGEEFGDGLLILPYAPVPAA